MPLTRQKILFFSSVVWNFYKARPQELPLSLLEYFDYKCIYVEPIVYQEPKSIRLKNLVSNETKGIKVIKRKTNLKKGFLLFICENLNNIYQVMKFKPDIVVSNDHLMSILTCVYCKIIRKKFIFDHIDNWIEIEKNKLVKFYLKYIFYPIIGRKSFAITNTSHYLQETMRKYNKRSYLIPNGKSSEDIEKFKTNNFHSQDKIVFIGSLRDWYNFDLLIEIFKNFPQLKLEIYGTGVMFNYINSRINNIKNIKLMGSVDGSRVLRLTTESLFGVLPLKKNHLNKGTCPIKLFDYWAAAKTVIATPTHELLKIGKDCCLFATTKEEWIKQIKKILVDENLRQRMGKLSFEKINNIYNYKIISAEFNRIIHQ